MRFKGAESSSDDFQFIKTEAADFESYKNCGTTPQIPDFLRKRQFTLRGECRLPGYHCRRVP
jgi:hypothetical protein